ncbi:HNH endonuclease [Paenibacillus sp. PL91]|uniref:HNH endonuclease n=1 Tax=Paenibacillus sp. PL91 TaxID=2729538 RepID=UPI00145F2B40|nr:HNH endonuclease [Paenibacillus sp. PL91]MBC9199794.1 HNH endonuclease [Paenibacillus sp. PL91]
MSASRAANQAVRELFYRLGREYDQYRGFNPFDHSNDTDIHVILGFFKYKCCYCRKKITAVLFDKDHLIPMNKKSGGLHSWGNVVPSCNSCNRDKNAKDWLSFISKMKIPSNQKESRIRRIKVFTERYKYNVDPSMSQGISTIATNLYAEVSAYTTNQVGIAQDIAKLLFAKPDK